MLGGKRKVIIQKQSETNKDQFIFYNTEKKFQQQIEIQVILNRNNSNKVMVIIDKKSTIDYLCIKIAEEMEKFKEYTNLEGLRAVNLSKKNERGMMVKLPSTGELKDCICDGDVIYCDLDTQEYWVKTLIKIQSNFSKLTISLDIKFRLDTMFKVIKLLLIKCGINFWIDYAKEKEDEFHYVFTNVKFKTLKSKNNFDLSLNDLYKASHLENLPVGDMFDIQSEVHCIIDLVSLEEMLHQELKKSVVDNSSKNKLRWTEYKDMTFDAFLLEKKFEPERIFITKFINKVLKNPNQKARKSFYLYDRNSKAIIQEDEDIISMIEDVQHALVIIPEFERKLIIQRHNSILSVNSENTDIRLKATIITNDDQDSGEIVKHMSTPRKTITKVSSSDQLLASNNKRNHNYSFLEKSKKIDDLYDSNESNDLTRSLIESESKNKDDCKVSYDDSLIRMKKQSDNLLQSGRKFNQNEVAIDLDNTISDENDHNFKDTKGKTGDFYKRGKSVHKHQSNVMLPSPHQNSEKFTSIFYKIRDTSKYSNLCQEFKLSIKENTFIELIEAYYSLKITKNALETVTMPRFRDLKIDTQGIESEVKASFTDENYNDEPIIVNIKKILVFISILLAIFIAAILFIFLSN